MEPQIQLNGERISEPSPNELETVMWLKEKQRNILKFIKKTVMKFSTSHGGQWNYGKIEHIFWKLLMSLQEI